MKKFKKVLYPLVALSLFGGTVAYADAIEHTLSGRVATSQYWSTVSDSTVGASYSYRHMDEIQEDGTYQIKFLKAKAESGTSSPSGSEFYNYQIVDVYGGGKGTKTQILGGKLTSGYSLITGVTLTSTTTKSAYSRSLVCADPSGCAGPQANYIYDTWIYKPRATFISPQENKGRDDINKIDEFKVINESNPVKKVNLKKLKNNIDYVDPTYVPSFMTLENVIQVEPPTDIVDKELRDKLNQWEIKYNSTKDNSFIHLIVTKGGNGIFGETEQIEINGNKAEIQENGELVTLNWKHKGISYWLAARTTDVLTKEEVLKFANSIN